MQYKMMQAAELGAQTISRFYGLNRLERGRNGEFKDMQGLSSDRYPCMSAARSSAAVFTHDKIQAVIAPKYGEEIKGITGAADGCFYYNGERKEFEDAAAMSIPPGAAVTLVDFNGRIIICAYTDGESRMYYYGYTASDDDVVHRMEKGIYNKRVTAYSSGNPDTDVEVTNYLTSSGEDWSVFSAGDAVTITGFATEKNNTHEIDSKFQNADKARPISAIVEKVENNRLYLQLYNYMHERLVFSRETSDDVSVYTGIPTMNHICIHNNRLWGTNPNGEYVYASKLGDPFNWNTFQGLSTDSYYAEVGTAGGFVGIVSYRDNLVAFKRDYIHHIYGDKPSSFSIPKQLSDCGCIDIKSAVQIGTSLYFLGYGGFYEYLGGQPELISSKLDRKYKRAVAATDGQKYIVSCTDNNGNDELLVYDTRYGTWHREKNITGTVGSFRRGETLYIASSDTVYKYGGGEVQDWYCEGVIMTENTFEDKGIVELWIRAKLGENSKINVRTAEEGGDWVGSFQMNKKGLHRYHIPVRFISGDYYAFRLEGEGEAVILDIERKVVSGGRDYYVHR